LDEEFRVLERNTRKEVLTTDPMAGCTVFMNGDTNLANVDERESSLSSDYKGFSVLQVHPD
jgi:hypothetical protein